MRNICRAKTFKGQAMTAQRVSIREKAQMIQGQARHLLITGVATALLLSTASIAQAQGRTESARPLGMGSAFTAAASGNGALYHNPAGVGTISIYTLEGSFFVARGTNTLNASIVDSKLNPKLAAGAAYSFEFSSDDDRSLTGHDTRVALASPVIPKRLIIGIGGRYLKVLEGDGSVQIEQFNDFTLDVGAILRISDSILLGVSGNNIIDVCEGKTNCSNDVAPQSVGGGLAFGTPGGFQLTGDFRADFRNEEPLLIYATGGELLVAGMLALRAGYQFRDPVLPKASLSLNSSAPLLLEDHVLALGGGIKTSTVSFDVGFQRRFKSEESIFNVALQVSFF